MSTAAVKVGAIRWVVAVPAAEPIRIRTESREPTMTYAGREPVMAASSHKPSMVVEARRAQYGEPVEELVPPAG
jgi:hypothetical protein